MVLSDHDRLVLATLDYFVQDVPDWWSKPYLTTAIRSHVWKSYSQDAAKTTGVSATKSRVSELIEWKRKQLRRESRTMIPRRSSE